MLSTNQFQPAGLLPLPVTPQAPGWALRPGHSEMDSGVASSAALADALGQSHSSPSMHNDFDTDGLFGSLPHELRLHVLSFLPPNDLALCGRLSCKEAAQRFSEPRQRTAQVFSEPLLGHTATVTWDAKGAEAAMKQLTFRQKLHLMSRAAATGCAANVEVMWQLLQPHIFPGVHYTDRSIQYGDSAVPDLGSAAVSSGLAHLLPSLAQRCPGLLHPVRTLEAAARHCDLAGLQAAWGAVGQWLPTSGAANDERVAAPGQHQLEQEWPPPPPPLVEEEGARLCCDPAQKAWRRILAAAAGSPTPDALAKVEWALEEGRRHCRLPLEHVDVCGAAAASGDLARLAWMRDHGFPWGTVEALAAVVRHADLCFIQQLEQEGGYLPPAEDVEAWASEEVVVAAAASARDGEDKLLWLAGRGAELDSDDALEAAAGEGRHEALQLLLQHMQTHSDGLYLREEVFLAVFDRGDLAALRLLLQYAVHPGPYMIPDALFHWPANTPADGQRLVQAVRLLAEGCWDDLLFEGVLLEHPPLEGVAGRQPWAVCAALLALLPSDAQDLANAAREAAFSGCEATLEALVGMGVLQEQGNGLAKQWYVDAAAKGDRATLECLVRLGVPLGEGVLIDAVNRQAPLAALQWLVGQGVPLADWERAAMVRKLVCSVQPDIEREAWLQGVLDLQAQGGS